MNQDHTLQRQIDLRTLSAFSGLLGPSIMLHRLEGNLKAEAANVRFIISGAIDVLRENGHEESAKGLEAALRTINERFKASNGHSHQTNRVEARKGA